MLTLQELELLLKCVKASVMALQSLGRPVGKEYEDIVDHLSAERSIMLRTGSPPDLPKEH